MGVRACARARITRLAACEADTHTVYYVRGYCGDSSVVDRELDIREHPHAFAFGRPVPTPRGAVPAPGTPALVYQDVVLAGVLCASGGGDGGQQPVFVAEDCLLMRVSVAARDVVERLKTLGMRARSARAPTQAAALFETLDGRRPAALQCDVMGGAPPPVYKRHMSPGQCGAVARAVPPALRALPRRPGVAVVNK